MKNILRLTTGSLILAGASFFVMSDSAIGYSTIGGSLNLGQRDFRVHDNFSGSSANNNSTNHSNWPGYTGAELSIWKGGAEWNSRPHGDGSGDSSQSDVGSGGANMTFFWEGMASGIGNSNDNIVSSIGGSSGGVLAYCETPINDGWRIRFYGDAWNWQDGPGSVNSGMDIQGVACHELGHSLGLGHSTAGGSPTMNAYISGSGTGQRSLASDDINGVKSIYSTMSSTMPKIDNVSVQGSTVTITGSGFSSSTNRVWLMSDLLDGGNSGGDHATVADVPSSNGTSMTFQLPSSG
ncbi:MAG: matrixin family metalloprotease, partial [Planctomycetes bacterium]|nr:matrixin family metalloprotease [Planctomycetota bacterium]